MNAMRHLLLPALAALSLSACATQPTVYQPAAGPQAIGYSEYRIEPGRYRITFQGGPGAPPERVADLALRRAADLTLADGYDWFQVSERFIRPSGGGGSQMSVGVGGGNFGYHSGAAVGLGTSFNLGGGPSVASTMEVVMGRGPRPPGANVYDARGVHGAATQGAHI
jgi:hypothetical protein